MTKEEYLWTERAVKNALGIETSADRWQANDVSIDSRTIKAGDLFVAIAGPHFDGHDFVKNAFEAGAVAAIVSRLPENLPPNSNLIKAADTLKALELIGCASRARSSAKIIAVTGSVGKTGTKEALRHLLSEQGDTYATVGSFNNHWGVPLSLARMPQTTKFGIFELGMNHPGELTPLSKMVQPDITLITTIEAVHAEFFASVDEIADAKAEIFSGLKPGGAAILNRDNPQYRRLADHAAQADVTQILSFGIDAAADFRLLDCSLDAEGSDVRAIWQGKEIHYRVGVAGRHWVQNSLGVLLATILAGADLAKAAQSFATMTPPAGRGERHRLSRPGGGQFLLIDDSYNASPASVRAAMDVLATIKPGPGGRRIAILGDMLELGDQSPALHAGLADSLKAAKVDQLFCCGPLMRHLYEAVPPDMRGAHSADAKSLLPLAAPAIESGDVVLCKSSKGSKVSVIVSYLIEGGTHPGKLKVAG